MRQVRQISIVRGWVNNRLGSNNAFSPMEAVGNYPIWTINYRPELEFVNDSAIRALSGYQRAGISGQRVNVNIALRGGHPAEYERLRKLVSSLSSQADRKAFDITVSDVKTGDQEITIATASKGGSFYPLALTPFSVTDGITNCYIRNLSTNQTRLATSFNATSKVVGLTGQSIGTWTTGHTYEIVLLRSQPTVVGIATVPNLLPANTLYNSGEESWKNGFIWCNLTSSSYDLNRELTVGTQVVSLQFQSVERFNEIPAYATVQGPVVPTPIS